MTVGTFTKFSADQLHQQLETLAEKWMDAQAEYRSLDVATKPLLADLVLEFQSHQKTSRVQALTHAESDARYKNHLQGLIIAEEKCIRAKLRYNNMLQLAELRRSEEASARTLVTRN